LQATLHANERAAAAFHYHLADDMAEIKTMLYGVIKEKAEQKITLPSPLRSHCHQDTDTKIATTPAPFSLSVSTFASNPARQRTRSS